MVRLQRTHHGIAYCFQTPPTWWDDGAAEDSIGLVNGGDTIVLNEFDVIPGAETITSISIAWGTPVFPDPSLNGLHYTAILWSDNSGTGNPADGVTVLATLPGVVVSQGTDTFIVSNIPDTVVTTSKFYVGFIVTHSAGQYPAAFDESAPLSNRSYAAGDGTPGNGDVNNLNNNEFPVSPIESFGLVGNWLVRADTAGGGGGIALSAFPRKGQGSDRLVALSSTPANGGSVNVYRDGVVLRRTDDDGRTQDNLGIGPKESIPIKSVRQTRTAARTKSRSKLPGMANKR